LPFLEGPGYLFGMAGKLGRVTTGIKTADEAFAALGKHLEELARIPLRAWDRYRTGVAPAMAKPTNNARASVMQALMVEELEAAFGGEVARRNGRALLCTVPGLVIQCKKLNDRGVPQNYPTKLAQKFARQLAIPGIPPGTRLTLGYMLDARGTAVAAVRLLAQMGHGVAWSRELVVNQTVMSIFAPTTAAPAPETTAAAPKERGLQPKGAAKVKKERKSEE
jgi:hypothetical protein